MSFSSLSFLFFFVITASLYFRIPYRFRWILLLSASYYFYFCFEVWYAAVLIPLTLVNYFTGIKLGNDGNGKTRRLTLALCLVLNIGILSVFKYFNLVRDTIGAIPGFMDHPANASALSLLLPVGLSFYSFKLMNYIIDVYRGKKTPETHLGVFALYTAFFPQLVAGPIDRATDLLPQFHQRFDFDYLRVTSGMKLMLWGFFQKLVIADTLSTLADPVFNNPTQYQGMSLFVASIFFTFQIYADFSGYSDIAIGAARIFGYRSMNNFQRPYFATSMPEFWQRWHISLSTWFRDYLYIPLGGNRVPAFRWYLNLFLIFLISGLWHGSNWTFAVWGAIHGFFYIFSVTTEKARKAFTSRIGLPKIPALHTLIKVTITFLLANFAWIFFRANSVSDGFYIVSHIFTAWGQGAGAVFSFVPAEFELVVGVAGIIILMIANLLQRHGTVERQLLTKPLWLRWALYYSGVLAILLFGNLGVKNFIYFQF